LGQCVGSVLTNEIQRFKRWLEQQGIHFSAEKGSHLHAELNGKRSIVPFHGVKEIPNPLVKKSKKTWI
jgi:mRNA interferase HicA